MSYGNGDGKMGKQSEASAIRTMTLRLYRTMPGAPLPPMDDGYYMWGEVEGYDYWCFCETLAGEIVRSSARAYVEADLSF